MQILPISNSDFFQTAADTSASVSFDTAMQDALDAVSQGEYLTAENALKEESPKVESPYTRHTTDGVTYTMNEVLFTKQELAQLRLELLKEGAAEESLQQFDILADQPNGATLAQVLASLKGKRNISGMDENDAHAITAFLGQLDPSGDLAASVLNEMRSGNGLAALTLIQNALGKLDSMDAIEIDQNTAISLGKGLGLNADSLRLLVGQFADAESLTLNAALFDELMTPAKNFFLSEQASKEKLDAALDKTLKQIISKARNRMEKEKQAESRESRRVQQSKVLIDKTVQENSKDMLNQALAGNEIPEKNLPENTLAKEHFANAANSGSAANTANAVNAKPLSNAAKEQTSADSDKKQDSSKGKSEGWNDLFAKIETKQTAAQPQTASSIIYSMLSGNMEDPQVTANNPLLSQEPLLAPQLASQVQQGLLTAMQDGSSRLDLQLHPAELGTLAITLIARNGEVTALIRSEKSETAEMMQRQVENIRINLENQGVRVDKIEVQLENRQDNSQSGFQDIGQHNARQEEDARRQELARMRNLAIMRNNSRNQENSSLAQSMHNIAYTERYAGQALHIVA